MLTHAISLLVPLLGLVLNVITQVGLCRSRSVGLFPSHVLGFVIGACAVLATAEIPGETFDGIFANFLIYSSLSYVYFQLNHMGETARRVRIARELEPGSLTRSEIFTRYGSKEIIDRRIQRLIASKQVVEKEDRLYWNGSTIFGIALVINILKELIFPDRNHHTIQGQ